MREKLSSECSDQVRHKQDCAATEDGYRLESSDLEERLYCVVKTISLISYVATAQLTCGFVLAYKKLVFS